MIFFYQENLKRIPLLEMKLYATRLFKIIIPDAMYEVAST